MSVDRIPASVAIIACNEEARIAKCLESVRNFDEVVIVIDARTTDSTADIAQKYGCRIYFEHWKGFGPQKQSALDKCKNQWVMVMDSDEVLSPEAALEAAYVLQDKEPAAQAYSFPRKNFLHGKWLKHGDFWPDRQIRLVKKDNGRFQSLVHEKWVMKGGKIENLSGVIEHRSFGGYKDMLNTLDRYSTMIAEDLYSKGKRTNALAPAAHALWMFVRVYFLKKGFLDGFDGLASSVLKAGGSFFKYAKLLELQNRRDF